MAMVSELAIGYDRKYMEGPGEGSQQTHEMFLESRREEHRLVLALIDAWEDAVDHSGRHSYEYLSSIQENFGVNVSQRVKEAIDDIQERAEIAIAIERSRQNYTESHPQREKTHHERCYQKDGGNDHGNDHYDDDNDHADDDQIPETDEAEGSGKIYGEVKSMSFSDAGNIHGEEKSMSLSDAGNVYGEETSLDASSLLFTHQPGGVKSPEDSGGLHKVNEDTESSGRGDTLSPRSVISNHISPCERDAAVLCHEQTGSISEQPIPGLGDSDDTKHSEEKRRENDEIVPARGCKERGQNGEKISREIADMISEPCNLGEDSEDTWSDHMGKQNEEICNINDLHREEGIALTNNDDDCYIGDLVQTHHPNEGASGEAKCSRTSSYKSEFVIDEAGEASYSTCSTSVESLSLSEIKQKEQKSLEGHLPAIYNESDSVGASLWKEDMVRHLESDVHQGLITVEANIDLGNLKDHDRLQAILREQDQDTGHLSPEDQQRRLLEILREDDGHDDGVTRERFSSEKEEETRTSRYLEISERNLKDVDNTTVDPVIMKTEIGENVVCRHASPSRECHVKEGDEPSGGSHQNTPRCATFPSAFDLLENDTAPSAVDARLEVSGMARILYKRRDPGVTAVELLSEYTAHTSGLGGNRKFSPSACASFSSDTDTGLTRIISNCICHGEVIDPMDYVISNRIYSVGVISIMDRMSIDLIVDFATDTGLTRIISNRIDSVGVISIMDRMSIDPIVDFEKRIIDYHKRIVLLTDA